MTLTNAVREHWPEYLIEGWALGTFMVCAGLVATLLDAPGSPVRRVLPDPCGGKPLARSSLDLS
jgi:hypothetical protein